MQTFSECLIIWRMIEQGQNLSQEQQLSLSQQQRLSALQVTLVRMLEMPLAQYEQAVQNEIYDNPALEPFSDDDYGDYADGGSGSDYADGGSDYAGDGYGDSGDSSNGDGGDGYEDGGSGFDGNRDDDAFSGSGDRGRDELSEERESSEFERREEREQRDDALDSALENMGSDDRMSSDYRVMGDSMAAEQEEIIYGEAKSFYDGLMEQVAELDLDSTQREVMEYLIGSLDSDGLLRTSTADISDTLAIYHGIDVTTEYIDGLLSMLQSFDPAGIGAKNLQECLLLQIARREDGRMKKLMRRVVKRYFEEFTRKRWEKIRQHLQTTEAEAMQVINEIRRLNPRPGASLGETMGRSMQQITPDFIVEKDSSGRVTFSINGGSVPMLRVSADFEEQLKGFQQNQKSLNRMEKEALLYTKEKIERAQGYIDAIRKRHRSMTLTMQTIIELQKKFFTDGDDADLVPMTLKDVAERVGMDISTISRVCNSKYVDTPWGIYRLKHFFSSGVGAGNDGKEANSSRSVRAALVEIIKSEDKRKPLSDDTIASILTKKGFPVARRTVAKYRDMLGIPVARMRK